MTSDDRPRDIGELGLRAASSVVEQMLRISQQLANVRWPVTLFGTPEDTEPDADPTTNGNGNANGHRTNGSAAGLSPATRAGDIRALRADADRLIELYGDWTRTLLDGMTTLAEGGIGEAPDIVELGPAASGTTVTAVAFLHLFEGTTPTAPVLHFTDLTAHHHGTIAAAHLRAVPAEDADDPPGGGRLTLSLVAAVPRGTTPGTYYGHLLVEDIPEVHLPVRLVVVS